MGYHLTILRSRHGKQLPIPLDEAKHAALALGWEYDATPPTLLLRAGEGMAAVSYQEGELWTRNPEEWAIAPMISLAEALNARVRGDEFETYAADGTTFAHPDDASLRPKAARESHALLADYRRDQKRMRNVIVGFFVALAAIGYLIGKLFERA
jgi:hypothetical protein